MPVLLPFGPSKRKSTVCPAVIDVVVPGISMSVAKCPFARVA
ncbi:hypothetical protein WOSG25_300020 [Weissella oryzae SG25]|uniref:Uncharacterized protein n=1 Tax=Weissella oryzae (strain DSM 25784 / JCM 18191 / LMG 30913 / SG25) TaxID=1329250 RepID=A0A069CX75_WEIOS|nr:hypothetical protein WOSG25_300020 [Weissella oryzae SG25]